MTTKREAHWFEKTKVQNTEKKMYVGLKQPRGDGERYVTPARAAARETTSSRATQLEGLTHSPPLHAAHLTGR